MFSSGPAQHALGRPQDRRSAAGSSASRGLLQGAACPPSLAELIFCLHSVACLSSIGPTLLFRMFSAFPDVDSKMCVCVCVCVWTASRTAGRVEGRNPKSVPALRCHVRSQCRAPDEAPLHCGSPSSLWKKMKRKRQYTRKRDRCLNVIALLPGFYWTSHSAAASATRLGFSPPPLP